MTYKEKLLDPRWQKKRLEILKRDKWTCQLCGDTEITLHVHHKSYGNNPWESNNNSLITLCEHCHAVVEYYKSENFLSTPIKVLKEKAETFYILNVITRSRSGERFAVFMFEFIIHDKEIKFIGAVFSEMLDAINKELRIHKKRK